MLYSNLIGERSSRRSSSVSGGSSSDSASKENNKNIKFLSPDEKRRIKNERYYVNDDSDINVIILTALWYIYCCLAFHYKVPVHWFTHQLIKIFTNLISLILCRASVAKWCKAHLQITAPLASGRFESHSVRSMLVSSFAEGWWFFWPLQFISNIPELTALILVKESWLGLKQN